ncbi:hypothetical protein JCGZ_18580 [Jatropha curcas]|uniref:Uncharacterized protein n=1 Tax=Jatropha curcas TaxID=180498 RepID=A0A067K4M2_JATCU|nr:hypothetical protein JCGZ_18580 [Jatropha curcas]
MCNHFATLPESNHVTVVVGGITSFIAERFGVFGIGYGDKAIGKGEKEQITMIALVNMKINAKCEGYYYFHCKRGNIGGRPISVIGNNVDDLETDKEEDEKPTSTLETELKQEEEDPTNYFEDRQQLEEPHDEEEIEEDSEEETKEDPKEEELPLTQP